MVLDGWKCRVAQGLGFTNEKLMSNVRFECRHDAGIIKAKFMKMHPTLIASCSVDQTVRIWDSRTGEQVKALTGHTNIVLDFDIVGKDVFSCGDDGSIRRFKF